MIVLVWLVSCIICLPPLIGNKEQRVAMVTLYTHIFMF